MAADPARLEQVVNNLLDNALKYTPPGGRIIVAIERADDTALLRVRDLGTASSGALTEALKVLDADQISLELRGGD